MPDKYGVKQDKYCYPDTDILINLLNIRDAKELSDAETAFSAERYRTYQAPSLSINDFTLVHLKQLHPHLFQDLYTWAGELRDVDISKGDTQFCNCMRIEPEAKRLFDQIPTLATIRSREHFIEQVADIFCEINLLHPFREGNGRVQRFFFEEMLFTFGHDVTWPNIFQQEWIDANVAGVSLDLTLLKNIFNKAITAR